MGNLSFMRLVLCDNENMNQENEAQFIEKCPSRKRRKVLSTVHHDPNLVQPLDQPVPRVAQDLPRVGQDIPRMAQVTPKVIRPIPIRPRPIRPRPIPKVVQPVPSEPHSYSETDCKSNSQEHCQSETFRFYDTLNFKLREKGCFERFFKHFLRHDRKNVGK